MSMLGSRRGNLKLCKDLKYGKVHLRQSLIELDQIEDTEKMFRIKRDHYQIQDLDIKIDKPATEENEDEHQSFMSPLERIEMYKKEKMNKKIKEKMSKYFEQKHIGHIKTLKPKTQKLLQDFQQRYRHQMPISSKSDLRESEICLNKIKKNDKRKLQIQAKHQKPLYVSRKTIKKHYKTSQNYQGDEHARNRFMSLKTSLPQRQIQQCQNIKDVVRGRNRDEVKPKAIDVRNIDRMLESYLQNKVLKSGDKQTKNDEVSNYRGQNIGVIKNDTPKGIYNRRLRTKSTVEKSFKKSEQASKQIIETMSSFYQIKHRKKGIYDEMIENVKYDRPLTSLIRRRTYTVLGRESLNSIHEYRQESEKQRRQIRQANLCFYKSLFEGLESFHEEDIPTTIYIIDEVKRIFESEYHFTYEIFNDLIKTVSEMSFDSKTQSTLQKIGDFMGYEVHVLRDDK